MEKENLLEDTLDWGNPSITWPTVWVKSQVSDLLDHNSGILNPKKIKERLLEFCDTPIDFKRLYYVWYKNAGMQCNMDDIYDNVFGEDGENTIVVDYNMDNNSEAFEKTIKYLLEKYPSTTLQGLQPETIKKIERWNFCFNIMISILWELLWENNIYADGKKIVILWPTNLASHFQNHDSYGNRTWHMPGDEINKFFVKIWSSQIDIKRSTGDYKFWHFDLWVTPHNYNDLLTIFWLKKNEISVLKLQNGINQIFSEYPELYEKYLSSKMRDLQTYCSINLIRNGNFQIVYRNLDDIFAGRTQYDMDYVGNKMLQYLKNKEEKELFKKYISRTNINIIFDTEDDD